MKTQQKKRRSLALIAALILCITTILPLAVSADTLPARPAGAAFWAVTCSDWITPNTGCSYGFSSAPFVIFYHNTTGETRREGSDLSGFLCLEEQYVSDAPGGIIPYWVIKNYDTVFSTYNAREWSVYVYPSSDVDGSLVFPTVYGSELDCESYDQFELDMEDYGDWSDTRSSFMGEIDGAAYLLEYEETFRYAFSYGGSFSEFYQEGYAAGFDEGHSAGKSQGYNEGYYEGLDEGYDNGYSTGYAEGETDALNAEGTLMDLVFGIFAAPIDLINNTLNFDLFGINLAGLVRTIITLAAAAIFITAIVKVGAGKG